MLVLSRKPNERIQIGEGVEIVVVAVQGNHVRLGITAPRETRICRSELFPESDHFPPDDQWTGQLACPTQERELLIQGIMSKLRKGKSC